MDLTVQEVSTLLQVSEEVIQVWLEKGKIPGYRFQNEVRFSREEIDEWVVRHYDQVQMDSEISQGTKQFNLYRALHRGYVLKDVEGDTKEELIQNTMQKVAKDLELNAEGMTELLLDRERLMPTALNKGIAVPHTRDFLLSKMYDVVVVVYPKNPLEFGALDNKPVHTLFFLFACQDKRHLNLLAKIAFFCTQNEHLALLEEKPDKKELLNAIRTWESQIAQLQPA